ncbi:hypothetical protein BS47DRAFT_1336638 [Hydnum rufescens UP504]|uniref:Uncharacterized protein n=1 Tax=Hydnum rufescens UP504 TaxID=1448309 RepID=A0A9P6B8W6_9AGAM|nr:hypothetical protein BS47DRAFT_1336638 [Hydnum rufescens UP504]
MTLCAWFPSLVPVRVGTLLARLPHRPKGKEAPPQPIRHSILSYKGPVPRSPGPCPCRPRGTGVSDILHLTKMDSVFLFLLELGS